MEDADREVSSLAIAEMRPSDIFDVVRLERESGLNSLGRDGFERQIVRFGSILLVARIANSGIVGSLSGWVVADEFQIDNVVVARDSRRHGIGLRLMRQGARAASALGAQKAVLEVRSANYPARVLYEKLGFALVGQRSEYYRDPTDDALIMICRDGDWKRFVA